MQMRCGWLLILGLVAGAPPVLAQPPSPPSSTAIDHQGVACIIVAKYPKLKACFGTEVKEPRAYFRGEGDVNWYWVRMVRNVKEAPEPLCLISVLPRPTQKLIHKHVEYYLEDVGGGARTKEYDPLVVRTAQECKKDAPVAPISPTGPTAVFPAMPAGFAVGSFPTVAVGLATAAVAGTGVYFATKKDETPAAGPTPAPAPSVPATTTTPTPPPPTPPPTIPPLDLSCQAEPKSGVVPLTVTFTAFASGGTGSYDYSWNFGDGGSSVGRHPVHTFTSVGTFDVILTVTSGDKVKQCERFVTVNAAPPKTATLTFTSVDGAQDCNGPPSVNIAPPASDCVGTPKPGTTCTNTYSSGTLVKITSSTNCGSEVCWSGACLGTPTNLGSVCTVTMDSDKTAGATFIFGTCITTAEPPVSLTWSVDLEAAGAVGQVVMDGQLVVAETGRRVQHASRSREGEIIVSASIVRADGKPGTWRFEAQEAAAMVPGSLRVQQGDVDLLTPTAVVFRLRGEAGEHVSFTYRLRR